MKSYKKSRSIFQEALNLLPGGVNSPVRAFKSVEGDPIVINRGSGAYLYDVDENKYKHLKVVSTDDEVIITSSLEQQPLTLMTGEGDIL